MDEYPYPLSVEVTRTSGSLKGIKNKLQIYFQSKKKSNGGDCLVDPEESNAAKAVVYFKSEEVKNRVLAKDDHAITIDNETVKLRVSPEVHPTSQTITSKYEEISGDPPDNANHLLPASANAGAAKEDAKVSPKSMAVVLGNVPGSMHRDTLGMMVESVCKIDEEDYTLEVLFETNTAVVTFNNSDGVECILMASQSHKKFKQHNMTAWELERSQGIRVENLPKTVSGEMLELYFEKVGGQTNSVTMIPEEQAAIVTFDDPKIVEAVQTKSHVICSVPVKVYPYYTSLGSALYGKDRPTWKVPDIFIEVVNPAVRKYLLLKRQFNHINDQMKQVFCQVDLDEPEAKLSPLPSLMRQKGFHAKQLDRWKDDALVAFRRILADYGAFQCDAVAPVWKAVEKEVRSVVKEDAVLMFDSSRATLTVAGLHADIKRLRTPVENVVLGATNRIERKRDGVVEEMDVSPAQYYILQQGGLQQKAADICPEIALHYKENKTLGIRGLPAEVYKVKSWILEKELQMSRRQLNLDPSLLLFLRSVDSTEMSQVLFTSQGICAIYHIQEREIVLMASSEKALAVAEQRMRTTLCHQVVVVEDQAVLRKPEWKQLNAQLLDSFNSSKMKAVVIHFDPERGNVVTVSGFLNPVKEVTENLAGFVEKFSRVQEALRVKSCAVVKFMQDYKSSDLNNLSSEIQVSMVSLSRKIKLSGPRLYVQKAKAFLQKMAQDLYTDELTIEKPGARKYFLADGQIFLSTVMKELDCVVLLQEDRMLGEEDEEGEDEENPYGFGTSTYCEVRTSNGVLVTVNRADICTFKADAVVNAANEDLNHIGGLALALLKAAGPVLQKLSDDHVKRFGPLKPGNAVATDAGELPCRHVVHAVGPRFSDWDRRTAVMRLKDAVHSSLREAVKVQCRTVALPAISSGIFGFPLDLCAETIALAVREYCDQGKGPGFLTEIYLVDNNDNTVRAMAKAVAGQFKDLWPKLSIPPEGAAVKAKQKMRGGGRGFEQNGAAFGDQLVMGSGGRGRGGFGRGEDGGHSTRGGFNRQEFQERVSEENRFEGDRRSDCLDTQWTLEGLKITLKKGSIQEQRTDVIVNTIADNLDLSQGAVSKSILTAAGPRLQAAVRDEASSSRLDHGHVVVTDGFNLHCRRVFHVVCPYWDQGAGQSKKILKKIIRYCLKEAEKLRLASLSFPAIGTGNMGFPRQLVSRLVLDEVKVYSQKMTPTYLKEVAIVVHPQDTQTVECFVGEFKGQTHEVSRGGSQGFSQSRNSSAGPSHPPPATFGQVVSPSLGVYRMKMDWLTFEVSSGDITKETCDVIVNSSNKDFNLGTGVSKAILDAAGSSVERECSTIVNSQSFQPTSMILTSAGSLPCKNIVHIVGQNDPGRIKETVFDVLMLCEQQKASSVSFPALGTGLGGASPDAAADAMTDAVVDFVRKKGGRHLNIVKIVIFQPAMVNDFHKSMRKREGEKVEERSIMTKLKDSFTFIFMPNEERSGNKPLVMKGEEFAPAVFLLCAGSPQAVSQAKLRISDLIVKEQAERTIKNLRISQLSPEQVDQLKELQRKLTVSIHLEKRGRDSFIRLEGLTRDVLSAEGDIRDLVEKVEKAESDREKAFLLSSVVEWQYLDRRDTRVAFDELTNYMLEEALVYHHKVKVKIDKEDYDVDFIREIAVQSRGRREVKLYRKDLKTSDQLSLPSNWKDMKGSLTKEVLLSPQSSEYKEVEQECSKKGLKVTSIERVQNPTLWQNYQLKKKEIEKKNNHQNNEKHLYHGTNDTSIKHINAHGFNRSFAGAHGAMYGNGSYFAVDPAYSYGYATPDSQGHKRMYKALVLVGDHTQGKAGLLVPPAKNSGNAAELYDSLTDNTASPKMYVIFNDVQAYPAYLITMQ